MRYFGIIFFFLMFLNGAYAQDPEPKKVDVVIGIDKSIEIGLAYDPKNVSVGNESFFDLVFIPQKKEIVIKGKKPGETNITIRDATGDPKESYRVNVSNTDQSKVLKDLKEFLGEVEGLEIGIKGDKVFIGGEIIVPTDIGLINTVMGSGDFGNVLNFVELSPHAQKLVAKKMQDEIQKNGIGEVTIRIVNKVYWLEGVVDSKAKSDKAMQIAEALLPAKIESLAEKTGALQNVKRSLIQNFININEKSKPAPTPKMVKITAQFVELAKDYQRIFGFKWVPFMSGDGGSISFGKTQSGDVTTESSETLSGTINNLFPKLNSARSAGYARVIQSGVVITENEKPATINKTATKNFALGTGDFTRAQTATSGFKLEVQPRILQQENIELGMKFDISSTVGSTDTPEILNNTVNTQMVVKNKESAVVGGVVVSKSATDFDKDPPFGPDSSENGTPLFSFIRSKSYTNAKSQFVIFVTPEIIESASEGTEKVKQVFRKRTR